MRSRLIVVALAVTSIIALAFLIPLAILVRDLAADKERASAEQDAESLTRLLAFVRPDQAAASVANLIGADNSHQGRRVALIMEDGTIVGAAELADTDLNGPFSGTTMRRGLSGGEAIYIPLIRPDGNNVVVAVFSTTEALTSGVARAWLILAALGAILVGVAIAVADRLGRSIVEPIHDLSEAATELGSGDLTVRVEPSGPPELHRVGVAFNRLAQQVARLLQREREEAADLSHRLRTPLTAARLNAEGLPDDKRKERLIEQLDDVERVVDHMIHEVRRTERETGSSPCDAIATVRQRAAFWGPLADDEGRDLAIDMPRGAALVAVSEQDLSAAVDALVGNVFAHTPAGVPLLLEVSMDAAAVEIIIADGGNGYPSYAPVKERGSSAAGSTGLGLDIVTRTATAGGGGLELGVSALGGAQATLRLARVDSW